MEKLELPRASKVKIHELPSEYYYRIPERTIWKTYPIYAPGKEPAGYWKWLQQQEPKKAVEWDKLRTKADWIRAGSLALRIRGRLLRSGEGFSAGTRPRLVQSNGSENHAGWIDALLPLRDSAEGKGRGHPWIPARRVIRA